MCYSLTELRGDTIQDDINEVMVSHLGIDIESIDDVHVFLDSPCVLEITDLIQSPVQLTVVGIVFPNGVLDFLTGSVPVPVSFPPFQCFTFRA